MSGLRIAGIVLVFLGIALVLNSGIFLTGLAVANASSGDLGYIVRGGGFLGGIFLLIGAMLLVESRKK